MKLLSLLISASFLMSATAQAGLLWDLQVAFRKNAGCPSKPCDSATGVPDKVTPKKVALTFDDGPSSIYTPKILEVLKKHNIKATFFVLGKNVEANKELLRKMVEEGHIVGNHSWSHPNIWSLEPEQTEKEILNTHNALLKIGINAEYFRFPNGNANAKGREVLARKGYKIAGWHVDTCDWGFKNGTLSADNNDKCNGVSSTVTDALPYLVKKIKSKGGGVILMHDTQKVTADNLDAVITNLKEDGYDFGLLDSKIYPQLNHGL